MDRPNIFVRILRFLWRLLGVVRVLVQLLVLLVVVALLVALFQGQTIVVPDSAALVLAPSGQLVEELADDPVSRALADAQGIPPNETQVSDLVDALEAAAEDDRIKAVVLSLGRLEGGGLSKLRQIAAAMATFRESGKPIIAMGDAYSQPQYYLAAHADQVYLHGLGSVYLEGFGYFRTYFREALEKLRVDMEVFRVGKYKSFVEPFTRDDMSPEDKEASRRWLDAMWAAYRQDVVAARGLESGAVDAYANEFADRAEALNGDLAQIAVDASLVDAIKGRLEFDAYMRELVGEAEDESTGFASIEHSAYLQAVRKPERGKRTYNVGIVVAAGEIVDGNAQPGAVGGDTLSRLVREAAEDDAVDALVLRIDSPGGSMFASEVVYEALAGLKATGKPLVASMGSVAASGGYYIAMPADEILADATTITGSIGVGALLPTFRRSLAELGIHSDGIGTTVLSGQADLARGLGPDVRRIIQASVDDAYRKFIQRVADSRQMSLERVENLARGRVWIGEDAVELGLVDTLGDLDDAIDVAAERAGLEPDEFGVYYIEPPIDVRQQLFLRLISAAGKVAGWAGWSQWGGDALAIRRYLSGIGSELDSLMRLNDPRNLYFHCFCELR